MSDRLANRFAALNGRAGLVTFVCGGDPSPDLTAPILPAQLLNTAGIVGAAWEADRAAQA